MPRSPCSLSRPSAPPRTGVPALDGKRKGLWRLAAFPSGRAFQRFERARLVEVDHRVELVGEPGVEVVTQPLRLGPVDDADRALEARTAQVFDRLLGAQMEEKGRNRDLVEEQFVAVGQTRSHPLPL